jgi:hypothetical protein
MLFPMIGEPGAEKILLFSGVLPVPALESNGVRVLVHAAISSFDYPQTEARLINNHIAR